MTRASDAITLSFPVPEGVGQRRKAFLSLLEAQLLLPVFDDPLLHVLIYL
jgi:hypothetical protein